VTSIAGPQPVLLGALAVGVAYYIGAKVGFLLTPTTQPVSTLWPPNALLLGALLIARTRSWPLLLASALIAHLLVELHEGVPVLMVLSWFVSNSAEAVIGAAGVRWLNKGQIRLDTFKGVGVFIAVGAIAAPFITSFLDAGLIVWNRFGTTPFWDMWRVRFFSNVLAILALVPVTVAWRNKGLATLRTIAPRRVLEASLLVSGLLVVSALIFARPAGEVPATPLLFVPLPFLLWAAVRFGPAGTSFCLLIVAVLSVWGAIHGDGPFVGRTMYENVLSLQLFLIATCIPLMGLTAVIRERGQAEVEARQNEERLNMVLTSAQMGTWDWDIASDRATWSAKTREILGLGDERSDVQRRGYFDAIHPEDRVQVREAIARAIEQGTPYEAEFRVTRPDGTIRWVLGKGTVVKQSGQPVRMVGVHADVTGRKLAETALRDEAMLRESEARFRELADAMPQIVFTARADGEIDYFNRKWYELTGTAADIIGGTRWLRVLHSDDRDDYIEAWLANVRDERPFEYESRFWCASTRSYRWHLARALPVRDESGAMIRWYGTATDIDDHKRVEQTLRDAEAKLQAFKLWLEHRVTVRTAELSIANATLRSEIDVRVRTERALRSSEERFAKAFRASPDAISIARLPEGRLIEVNERWEATFGHSRAEALGQTFEALEIFAEPDDNARFLGLVAAQGFVKELELELRHKSGASLTGILTVETVDVGGEACLITMVRDITERRRVEHELELQRRQLAHLGRVALLGELSGALAHELNQPLAAILANARAAQRMLEPGSQDLEEVRAILDDIVADDRRAGAVIRRVRALIRRDDAELQLVGANELVTDVLDLAHSDLIQRAVSVTTHFAPEVSTVLADRVQLQQVVLNLIVNACDAMAHLPPVGRNLIISTAEEDSGVRLSVADRGTGIQSGSVDAVFEPFVTSKAHGLGLGLTICRSIVDQHGGRMWATNNEERGATFHVLLPRAPADVQVDRHATTIGMA
jgi:PAS domain S-box-containing protein